MSCLPTPAGADQGEADAFKRFVARRFPKGCRDVVLIQPPFVPRTIFDVETAHRQGYYNFPPVGLLYLAAAVRRAHPHVRVHILDINHELLLSSRDQGPDFDFWHARLDDILAGCEEPMVGISYMFGTTRDWFLEIANHVRARYPDRPLAAGGVQATYDWAELLRDGVCDLIVRREGEIQLADLLDAVNGGNALPAGVAFVEDGLRTLGEPADDQPADWDLSDAYDLIDISRYHEAGCLGAFSHLVAEDEPFATVLSGRGCRARCTFCTVRNFNGFGVRRRSIDHVVAEVRHLVQERGVRHIDWLDDDLLFDRARTIQLFKRLADEVPGLRWTASNGLIAVSVDEEMMEWMVRSGLRAFKIGVESGNEQVLKSVKKPATRKKLLERKHILGGYPEVFASPNFILGFPGETFSQMMDSFELAVALDLDWTSFYICQPLKGTEMFSAFQAIGDSRCDDEDFSKTINPGRSSERGEFGYAFGVHDDLRVGWGVFDIRRDSIPDLAQQKEIWFTFNLVTNFLDNRNFRPGGNPAKLLRWLEAIHASYPHDASMAAALAHGKLLVGQQAEAEAMRDRFLDLCAGSGYWQGRVHQFPELLRLAGVDQAPAWLKGEIPAAFAGRLAERRLA